MPIVLARRPMLPLRRRNYVSRRGMGAPATTSAGNPSAAAILTAASQCASVGGTWSGSACLANSPGVVPQAFPAVDFSNPVAVAQAVLAGNPQAVAAQQAYNTAALKSTDAGTTAAALIAQGWDPYLAYLQTTGKQSGGAYNISPSGTVTAIPNPLAAVSFALPNQSNAPGAKTIPGTPSSTPAATPPAGTSQSNAPNAQIVSTPQGNLATLVRSKIQDAGTMLAVLGIPSWALWVAGGGVGLYLATKGGRR